VLRVSSEAEEIDADLSVIMAERDTSDGGIPSGAPLRRFAHAVLDALDANTAELVQARADLLAVVGDVGLCDAAGVVAHFNGITRIADATGTELDELQTDLATSMLEGLDLESLRHSGQ